MQHRTSCQCACVDITRFFLCENNIDISSFQASMDQLRLRLERERERRARKSAKESEVRLSLRRVRDRESASERANFL